MIMPPWKMNPRVVVPCAGFTISTTCLSNASSCATGEGQLRAITMSGSANKDRRLCEATGTEAAMPLTSHAPLYTSLTSGSGKCVPPAASCKSSGSRSPAVWAPRLAPTVQGSSRLKCILQLYSVSSRYACFPLCAGLYNLLRAWLRGSHSCRSVETWNSCQRQIDVPMAMLHNLRCGDHHQA
jgi:hypothetical protein